MPSRLGEYWARVGPGLDQHVAANRNRDVENLLQHLMAFMAHTVEDLPSRVTQNASLLGTLDPLDVLAFDALRSAAMAQRGLSLAGAVLACRVSFEASCTMRFITSAGDNALVLASRYARWMHVETLDHHRITEQPLPWDELVHHASQAAEWLEPDSFVVRRYAHWANDPRFNNLFAIARHLGDENLYRQIYGAGSAFVHASSTASRLYRHPDGLRQVAAPVHASRFSILTAGFTLRLHRAFLDFHGASYDASEVAAIMATIVAITEALNRNAPQPA